MTKSLHHLSAVTFLTVVVSVSALAADPVMVSQSNTDTVRLASAASAPAAYPAIETGVRRAAAEGNEALRRYIWRTRMIYNFYYNDFAKKE